MIHISYDFKLLVLFEVLLKIHIAFMQLPNEYTSGELCTIHSLSRFQKSLGPMITRTIGAVKPITLYKRAKI